LIRINYTIIFTPSLTTKLNFMTTETTLNPVQEMANELMTRANEAISKRGYFDLHTCDYPNWNRLEHYAMQYLKRNCPEGYSIGLNISGGVSEWAITLY
jgi:hypothetical protein